MHGVWIFPGLVLCWAMLLLRGRAVAVTADSRHPWDSAEKLSRSAGCWGAGRVGGITAFLFMIFKIFVRTQSYHKSRVSVLNV